ncbi:MAG: tetratricopeptide repeat protein [Bacteroidota bacterium]
MRVTAISLWVLTAFLMQPALARTHFTINNSCRNAHRLTLHLELNAANHMLKQAAASDADNVAIAYFQSQSHFVKAFISEEEADFVILQKSTDHCLELLDDLPENNPWKGQARSELLLRLALVKLKRQEFVSAGYNIRKAFMQSMDVRKKYPDFAPAKRTAGMLHMAMGSVPENYKWLANLAGMQGSIEQGAKEMDGAILSMKKDAEFGFLLDETLLMRAFCASHFEKNEQRALELVAKYANNASGLFLFFQVNTLVKAERFRDALAMLNNYKASTTSYPLHYVAFQKGLLQLGALQTKEASKSFATYVNNYKGNSFAKASLHKLAWISLLQGDSAGYKQNMSRVLTRGTSFTDEDQQAQRQAETGDVPNVYLLECRLLFDGGNYDEALEKLSAIPTSKVASLRDQLEFTYRMARICEKKKMTERAIRFYNSTYVNGKDHTWYFAANSALLLGNIYEKAGDKTKALEWYKKCLALRKHEYQNSIDQKAESGKNRVSK